MKITVAQGDILTFPVDVLALKYAQHPYGVDSKVLKTFLTNGIDIFHELPQIGKTFLTSSNNLISPNSVFFVGLPSLNKISYQEIRYFSQKALSALAYSAPGIQHLGLTLHGPGFGLQIQTAFTEEINGLLDTLQAGKFPETLEQITIVEHNHYRANKLKAYLHKIVRNGIIMMNPQYGFMRVTC
jgi:hypothetical protein